MFSRASDQSNDSKKRLISLSTEDLDILSHGLLAEFFQLPIDSCIIKYYLTFTMLVLSAYYKLIDTNTQRLFARIIKCVITIFCCSYRPHVKYSPDQLSGDSSSMRTMTALQNHFLSTLSCVRLFLINQCKQIS